MPVDVLIRPFSKEIDFEKALVDVLPKHGWESIVITNPTEENLIENWAFILYNNNREATRLGDFPLTKSEMQQVITQVDALKNPYEVNKFINGGFVKIRRDNEDDRLNFGKEVYLKIFDPQEIKAGQSVYQIVRQPKFNTKHPLASTRRGDVMLLINGIPMIHIELKRSGVDVSQAVNQIKKYTHEGVFSRGIFSLVQIFVAMTPEKSLYFANPGKAENFMPSYYFHWANFNNEEVYDWKRIAANLLSIPMAHQMIGYYTIADDKDETLKVLRSYQYFASTKIWERVSGTNWDDHHHRGGFIWHTTGSGKTMTSFKSAQLIAKANDADKVVFLLDRIELSTQSADEYRGFANANDNVLDTEDTRNLVSVLESDNKDECLIVTSIQKMSRINSDHHIAQSTIERINQKRVVFIVDECHRSVTGSGKDSGSGMLLSIKNTFPRALLFGFTGTPIFADNARGELTTEVIFGDMLHKYTLGNGIPDENVLGFDLYRVNTFQEHEVREAVALKAVEAECFEDIEKDKEKVELYNKWMYETEMIKVEDEAKSLYQSDAHHMAVMHKIVEERPKLSRNGKFHAILATKNIAEAIEYYRLFKEHYPEYNITAIFDDSIDNNGGGEYKEDAILEMLQDYNNKFGTSFQQSTYARFKKDVAKRLAHKKPYQVLEKDKQLDMLIVVTQMLTGYDSKWVNTLYVDKLMQYVDVIQAFSRTNRLFGPEKPFGIIKYFTRPERMAKNIEDALELYVDQPLSVFTDKLEANLEHINENFKQIEQLFKAESIEYYASLPQSEISKKKFAKEFCEMTKRLEASKMQGFLWENLEYEFEHSNRWTKVKLDIDEQTYKVLLQRYRELFIKTRGGGDDDDDDVYQLEAYITETGAGTIDAEYINSKFIKYLKELYTSGPNSELLKTAQAELHNAFATLSQTDQRTAIRILHDIESGDLRIQKGYTIYDYILEYQKRQCDKQVFTLSEATGMNVFALKELISKDTTEQNINEHGRFEELIKSINREKCIAFLKRVTGREVANRFVISNISNIVRRFILDSAVRAQIIYAYQTEGVYLDNNVPEVLPEEDEPVKETAEEKKQREEDNKLSFDEMKENVLALVKSDLIRIEGMPVVRDVVNSFFNIITVNTISSLDGVGFDLYKAMSELFGRKKVNFIDKHVNSGNLSVKFEVYLKKLYYMLHDKEVPAQEEGKTVALANCIFAFPCLKKLRFSEKKTEMKLSGYLQNIRDNRNTSDGNGAHASYLSTESQLDEKIKEFVTLYLYVTGMCLMELKEKYEV